MTHPQAEVNMGFRHLLPMEHKLRQEIGFIQRPFCATKLRSHSPMLRKKDTPPKHPVLLKAYSWALIVFGLLVLFITIQSLDYSRLDYSYLIFGFVTLVFASRIAVQIPGIKGHISVSDTFIFLSILIFGGEAGIILSAVDAVPASYRLSKTRLTLFFNIAVFAVSTFITVWSIRLFFGEPHVLPANENTSKYVAAICLMALVQYICNSGLVAVNVALRNNRPVWRMWRENFLWTSITYFAGASAAGIIAKSIGVVGIYAFLGAMPIVAVVYFTYTTYLKNVESAASQAKLAESHVQELSHYISEQARISRALQESEQYFRNAFDHAAGMAVVDPNGRWLQVNDSLCRMLGFTEIELLRQGFQAVTHPDDLGNDLENLRRLLDNKVSDYQLEKRYSHKSGSTVWVLQSVSLIRDVYSRPKHVVFQIQDISDRKKAEQIIHHAAFHDALTGLPNRTLFTDRLSMAIERAKRSDDYRFAVIFLDLDRFKIVNDSLGHGSGDQLLVELSRRLEKCSRAVDSVARLGGDEFAILLDGITTIAEAETVAERIQDSLKLPFELEGETFCTTASMGIACSTLGYDRPDDILRDADTAMYKAKSNGKACHEIFARQMHTRAIHALTVENELRLAFERGDIKPFYQPIVSLDSSEVVGFEALARWVHPERGLISPADFIPLAEECGLITQLDLSILDQACHQVVRWQEELDRPELCITVNVSGRQFKNANMVAEIKKILDETKLRPSSLNVEITETMVINDISAAITMLKNLKRTGVRISIDDFGTGYSSLSYLHRLPFDILKIDRCFISRMARNKESRGIVKAIIMLATELQKKLIAEGVETVEQHSLLRMIGCQYGQGYLFSKPLEANAAGQLIPAKDRYLERAQGSLSTPTQLIG